MRPLHLAVLFQPNVATRWVGYFNSSAFGQLFSIRVSGSQRTMIQCQSKAGDTEMPWACESLRGLLYAEVFLWEDNLSRLTHRYVHRNSAMQPDDVMTDA